MGHKVITFRVSCQLASLNDIMQSVAQTRSYLLCLWREYSALRRSRHRMHHLTICFQYACFQPFTDKI